MRLASTQSTTDIHVCAYNIYFKIIQIMTKLSGLIGMIPIYMKGIREQANMKVSHTVGEVCTLLFEHRR